MGFSEVPKDGPRAQGEFALGAGGILGGVEGVSGSGLNQGARAEAYEVMGGSGVFGEIVHGELIIADGAADAAGAAVLLCRAMGHDLPGGPRTGETHTVTAPTPQEANAGPLLNLQ